MAPLRLRHPGGVATIQLDLASATVQDLLLEVQKVTQILPSQQQFKAGYPPHALTIIPELPLESLGLQPGEQLIVSQSPGALAQPAFAPAPASTTAAAPPVPAILNPPQRAGAISGPSGGPDAVEVDGSYLVHRIVPDDNSCLFSSVALIFEQNISRASRVRQSEKQSPPLRKIVVITKPLISLSAVVAEEIRADPIRTPDNLSSRPRDDYISTILKPNTWGGAIELSILAKHYCTEIASVDVETGRIDHFTPPPDRDTGNRCILLYSGIHYDAATLAPMIDAPDDFHQTVIPVQGQSEEEDNVLGAAKKLADKLRAKRAYTNTATFDLRCQDCGQGLKGEKEARQHASQTGHINFGEY